MAVLVVVLALIGVGAYWVHLAKAQPGDAFELKIARFIQVKISRRADSDDDPEPPRKIDRGAR